RDRRMPVEPEQFLYADRNLRPAFRFVVDRGLRAGWRREMRRRFGIEPPPQRVGEARDQRRREITRRELSERGLAVEQRRKPIGVGGKCRIGYVRPFVTFGGAQEHDAIAPLPQRLGPRHTLDPEPRNALRKDARVLFARMNRHRLFGKRDCAEPPLASCAEARARLIERHFVARDDAAGEARLNLIRRDRRGQENAAGPRAAGHFGDREVRLARKRRGGIHIGAAAIDEQESAHSAAAVLRDALRISERQQRTGRQLLPTPLWGGVRGGGREILRPRRRACKHPSTVTRRLATLLPTLPHKGGGLALCKR